MTTFDAEVQCAILQAIENQTNRTAAALERVVALQERILCNKKRAAQSRGKEPEMASENETVAEVCAKLKEVANGQNVSNDGLVIEISQEKIWDALDRIEAAHKREVAELKHWIKSAARWIKCHDIYHTSGDDLIKQAKEILNDDGEFLFKKGEQ